MDPEQRIYFDPRKYDYLDKYKARQALCVYLWEFIRRNKALEEKPSASELREHGQLKKINRMPKRKDGYTDIFTYLKTIPETAIRLNYEYNILSPSERVVNIVSDSPDVQWCFDTLKRRFGITATFIDNDSRGYLQMQVTKSNTRIGIPDPSLGYDAIDPNPFIKGSSPVAYSRFNEEAHRKMHGEYLDTFVDKLTITSREHTIYVGIPVKGQPHAIKQALNKIIKDEVRKAKDVNTASKAWKSYLMYYDLSEDLKLKDKPKNEAETIAKIISQHCNKVSWKTVHEALTIIRPLIQSDFANYLFLA